MISKWMVEHLIGHVQAAKKELANVDLVRSLTSDYQLAIEMARFELDRLESELLQELDKKEEAEVE